MNSFYVYYLDFIHTLVTIVSNIKREIKCIRWFALQKIRYYRLVFFFTRALFNLTNLLTYFILIWLTYFLFDCTEIIAKHVKSNLERNSAVSFLNLVSILFIVIFRDTLSYIHCIFRISWYVFDKSVVSPNH